MGCCRRNLGQSQTFVVPRTQPVLPVVSTGPGPCYFVDLQGDYLGLRVIEGTIHVVTGAGTQEARGVLVACGTPRSKAALEVIDAAYSRNLPPALTQMVRDQVFTLSFLRTQVGT